MLMVIPQFKILMCSMYSIRVMITITSILFLMFFIHNGIRRILTNDSCKVSLFGNAPFQILNYVIIYLTWINIHYYFYMYGNETQIVDLCEKNHNYNYHCIASGSFNLTLTNLKEVIFLIW